MTLPFATVDIKESTPAVSTALSNEDNILLSAEKPTLQEKSNLLSFMEIEDILLADDVCDVVLETTLVEKLSEIMRCAVEWENM